MSLTNSPPLPDNTVSRFIVSADPSQYAHGTVFHHLKDAKVHRNALQAIMMKVNGTVYYIIELHYHPDEFANKNNPPIGIFVFDKDKRIRIL